MTSVFVLKLCASFGVECSSSGVKILRWFFLMFTVFPSNWQSMVLLSLISENIYVCKAACPLFMFFTSRASFINLKGFLTDFLPLNYCLCLWNGFPKHTKWFSHSELKFLLHHFLYIYVKKVISKNGLCIIYLKEHTSAISDRLIRITRNYIKLSNRQLKQLGLTRKVYSF